MTPVPGPTIFSSRHETGGILKRGLIIFLVFCLAVLPAAAQEYLSHEERNPPDKAQLALEYYNRCMDAVYADFSRRTREDFCACSAEAARAFLTGAEMETLARGGGKDPIDLKKLDAEVAAPCAGGVINELELTVCLDSGKMRQYFSTQDSYEAMCVCVGNRMEEFVTVYGRDIAAYLNQRAPGGGDIVTKIKMDINYNRELSRSQKDCLNAYVANGKLKQYKEKPNYQFTYK